jgi:hypothetical protein
MVGASLLVAGCTPDHGIGRSTLPARSQQNPDEDLVTGALRAEMIMLDRVRRTGHRFPRLRRRLDDAVHVHRAHVDLLEGTVTGPRVTMTSEPAVPHTTGAALAALVDAEQTLERAHRASAMRADSGVFARVLAGMAAAAAQQAVALSSPATNGPGA